MPNRCFLVPEWEYDFWRFKSKAYNGTKLIVSGWNMIIKSNAPVKTSFLFPAAEAKGKLAMSFGLWHLLTSTFLSD